MADNEKDIPAVGVEVSQAKKGVEVPQETEVDDGVGDTRADILNLQQLQYEPVTDENRNEFWDVIIACSEDLNDKGMSHWIDHKKPEVQETLLRPEDDIFIIRDNGRAIGTVLITEDPEEPDFFWISKLAVLPDLQGKGYGKNILGFAESQIKEKGGDFAVLDFAFYEDGRNDELEKFYRNRGYEEMNLHKIPDRDFDSKAMYKQL